MRVRTGVVLALGLVVPLVYGFPGMMSMDSYDILSEARRGVYTDGHPPFNAALWRYVDMVIPGPFGMLLLQLVTLHLGLWLLLRRATSHERAAWIAGGLLLWPPILAPLGVIWKDCFMAGMLTLGTGLVLGERRWVRVVGVVVLGCAIASRYNAFPAVFAVIVLLFQWRDGMRPLARYAIAFATWLAVTLCAFGVNKALTDKQMYFWHSTLAVFDIAGTLALVDEELPDATIEQLVAGTDLQVHERIQPTLRAHYRADDYIALISPEGQPLWKTRLYGEPAPPAQRAAIEAAWKRVVTTYPGAYLRHRLSVMGELLARHPTGNVPRREFGNKAIVESFGVPTRWSPLQRRMSRMLVLAQRHLPIFTPWLYLVVALLLLWPARKHRDVLALLVGALLLEGTLLVLAMSRDFRYSHWLIVATLLSAAMLTARRISSRTA